MTEEDASLGGEELIGAARRNLAPTSDLDSRLAHLRAAHDALKTRTPSATLDDAEALLARASSRLRLSADHTVVALAGATGSGKSSTFNALTGLDVASVGVRRPTTSWAMACLWGSDGAAELLEWLGIPQRHQVIRDSLLDKGDAEPLQGMVLLDLPDHDSTEMAHRLEVDRLVHLADVIVWVMDPQKYADAAIHDALLRPNVQHAAVMVAVVNHIDEVPEDGRHRLYQDARRLLDNDGLASVPLIATSARVGTGLDELRAELAARISDKAASRTRISADVDVIAQRLLDEFGAGPSSRNLPAVRSEMARQLAQSQQATQQATQQRSQGQVTSALLQPEIARNIVRAQARVLAEFAVPAAAETLTRCAVDEVDNLRAVLQASRTTPHKVTHEPRGGGRILTVLFFVLFVGGTAWLAAALVKGIPNVIAAGALTGVGLLAWLAALLRGRVGRSGRSGLSDNPVPVDLEAVMGAAVDRTVMRALGAEVSVYEKAAADLRCALSPR